METPEKIIYYDDIIVGIGFGKFQYLLLFTCAILKMMADNETMGMGMIVVAAKCDFKMSVERIAIVVVATFIGMILSGYFVGYFCDIIGRRKILLITVFSANISSFLSILMPYYWLFVIARFVTGIFLAGSASVPVTYLSELVALKHGSQVVNWMAAFTGISMVYCPTIGFILLTTKWNIPIYGHYKFTPWRLQILLYALPGFIGALILLIVLPESPKYLLATGREFEAEVVLDELCVKSTGKHLNEVLPADNIEGKIQASLSMAAFNDKKMFTLKNFWIETLPLFKKPLVGNFLLSCLMMFGLFYVANGLGVWYPTIRGHYHEKDNKHGSFCSTFSIRKYDPFKKDNADGECQSVRPEGAFDSIILGTTYILCFILQGVFLHFIGRKKTMMLVYALAFISVTSFVWQINDVNWKLVFFCIFLALPGITTNILASGVVNFTPTRQRGKAVCIVLMFGRMGAVLGMYIIQEIFDNYCYVIIGILLIFYLGMIVLTYRMPFD